MSESADQSLAELIAREQRGFRGILFAGLITLLVMGLVSAALGVYTYSASRALEKQSLDLQRQGFDIRRRVDQQRNRIATQEREVRRIYEELRGGGIIATATAQNLASATEASRHYLLRGRVPTLEQERLIRALSVTPADVAPPPQALFKGVIALMDFDASDETIGSGDLPARLSEALAAFEAARADPALSTLAAAGVGWVRFRAASADRRNYRADICDAVLAEVEASVPNGVPSPQPLFWRAQCQRMLGRTAASLPDYARAVRDSAAAAADPDSQDTAELTLAMNAFQGIGVALIAAADIPDSDPGLADAMATAREACPASGEAAAQRPERMALAVACLERAVTLRGALKQTDHQISRSREFIGFAYLRDGDYGAAYANAAEVEDAGLFARNEVLRALAASNAAFETPAERRAAAAAAAEARRNVSFFRLSQFNICELQSLLGAEHYAAAIDIIADAHAEDRDKIVCARESQP